MDVTSPAAGTPPLPCKPRRQATDVHKRPQKPARVLTSRSLCTSETLCDRMSDLMSGQKSDLPLDPWGALGSSTGLPPLLSTRCHCGQRARKTAPAGQDKPTAAEPPTSTGPSSGRERSCHPSPWDRRCPRSAYKVPKTRLPPFSLLCIQVPPKPGSTLTCSQRPSRAPPSLTGTGSLETVVLAPGPAAGNLPSGNNPKQRIYVWGRLHQH